MRQHEVQAAPGSRHARKRSGRGDGSGHGSYSGHGCKGQKARSGGHPRPGFEGGQLPIIKRLPQKRGFNNIFRQEYSVVNLKSLAGFAAQDEITPEKLAEVGFIRGDGLPLKVLGDGELDRAMVVKAHKFSASAEKKIVAAGGRVEKL